MIWFSEAGDIVFEKNEDLGWFVAGLIWLLSVSIILFFFFKVIFCCCCKRLPTSFWVEMLSIGSVTLLYSAGLVCSLPYPILPRSDRSLQWFWIPFFSLSKFQTFFLNSFLPVLFLWVCAMCLLWQKMNCLPSFQVITGKGKMAQFWVFKLLGDTAGVSLLLFVPRSSRRGCFLWYFRGSEWCLALPCMYEVLFQPSSLKSSSLSTFTSSKLNRCSFLFKLKTWTVIFPIWLYDSTRFWKD